MKKLVGGVVLGAALMTAASALFAGDLHHSLKDMPVVAPCCETNWTGFYIAGSIGFSGARSEIFHEVDNAGLVSLQEDELNASGVTGTVALGYDRQMGDRYVFGVFADYTFGNMEESSVLTAPAYAEPYTLKLEDSWAIGARFGFTSSQSTLWYLTAGYTQSDVDFSDAFSETLSGVFVGAGVERKLSQGLSVKLEYRYSNFQEDNLFELADTVCGGCAQRVDIDPEIHSIRLGVSYKFTDRRETFLK
jgi:outer membrane immunogenic protein